MVMLWRVRPGLLVILLRFVWSRRPTRWIVYQMSQYGSHPIHIAALKHKPGEVFSLEGSASRHGYDRPGC